MGQAEIQQVFDNLPYGKITVNKLYKEVIKVIKKANRIPITRKSLCVSIRRMVNNHEVTKFDDEYPHKYRIIKQVI